MDSVNSQHDKTTANPTLHITKSNSTKRLPQKPNLPISIALKQRPSVRIEMPTRKHMRLLWFAGFPISL